MANRSILIIGPSWVGDMVMAQSLFIALKQSEPEVEIDVLAPAWSRPIIERMPEIRDSIDMPIGHGQLLLKERRILGESLQGKYDQAIVLPNSLKSALIPYFAKVPKRTGWRGEMRYVLLNDIRKLDKSYYPLMVERFVALAHPKGAILEQPLPRPALQVDNEQAAALRDKFQLTDERPVLALCPGAEFGPAKRWPEEHYAAVAREKIDQGWQVWLLGSAKDQPVAETIVEHLQPEQADHCHILAGATELADAIDLLSQADAVISNDSGLMHIAAALQKPLVVVYGSTSPGFTPPLSERVEVVQLEVDCGPCFERQCPQGHLKCLKFLLPGQVLDALQRVVADEQVLEVSA
ncbi:MAG: lipopolysaccharide heptosyltransferase II [Candidatus Pelagadaptatus aseana]|uniref:lipopolysaccharide heptosyltransferase II n=1 Tax=Candidatus Pelagadaptatus aseana TaxID=3120508 RepID=UPI0039B19DE0